MTVTYSPASSRVSFVVCLCSLAATMPGTDHLLTLFTHVVCAIFSQLENCRCYFFHSFVKCMFKHVLQTYDLMTAS